MKPYRTNLIFAILLVLLGLWGLIARYAEQGDWQFTALIPAGFGGLLLILTPGLKKENKIIYHIVVLLTALVGAMAIGMLIDKGFDGSRKSWIFILIALGAVISLVRYISHFIKNRRRSKLAE